MLLLARYARCTAVNYTSVLSYDTLHWNDQYLFEENNQFVKVTVSWQMLKEKLSYQSRLHKTFTVAFQKWKLPQKISIER